MSVTTPDLSVIILTDSRDALLKKCLDSLDVSIRKVPDQVIEVILAGNCISPGIRSHLQGLGFAAIVCELAGAGKSALRNHALAKAAGEIVYYIDDDVFVEPDFAGKIIERFKKYPAAAALGGPNLTPPESNYFERAQGFILASGWGAAGMSRRYRPADGDIETGQKSFALCNLGFRRVILKETESFFDERLDYNEENDLLARLKSLGHIMIFTDINVFHYRRKSLKRFAAQVFDSGRGRARSIKISRRNFGLVYLFPPLFTLYAAGVPLYLAAGAYRFLWPLALYAALSAGACLRDMKFFPAALILFPLGHLSYGAGMIIGLTRKI